MAAAVKSEPTVAAADVDPIDLENRITELLTKSSEGLTNKEIMQHTAGVELEQRMAAINRLLSSNRVEMRRVAGGAANDFLLKLKQTATGIDGASKEEAVVYQGHSQTVTIYRVWDWRQIIEESGRMGIWVRDVRTQSGLSQAQLARVLRALETKKLVKSIKAVGANRKKMYMLYELEPDVALTGGTFWANQELDVQFVDLLNQQCVKLLRSRADQAAALHKGDVLAQKRASVVSATEVCQHIRDMKISRVELTVPDIERVLDTVVYDGCAQRVVQSSGKTGTGYRHVQRWEPRGATAASAPCALCPLVADCRPGGAVSPAACAYFDDWLVDAHAAHSGAGQLAADVKKEV